MAPAGPPELVNSHVMLPEARDAAQVWDGLIHTAAFDSGERVVEFPVWPSC